MTYSTSIALCPLQVARYADGSVGKLADIGVKNIGQKRFDARQDACDNLCAYLHYLRTLRGWGVGHYGDTERIRGVAQNSRSCITRRCLDTRSSEKLRDCLVSGRNARAAREADHVACIHFEEWTAERLGGGDGRVRDALAPESYCCDEALVQGWLLEFLCGSRYTWGDSYAHNLR